MKALILFDFIRFPTISKLSKMSKKMDFVDKKECGLKND
jgi:hypothetical protein